MTAQPAPEKPSANNPNEPPTVVAPGQPNYTATKNAVGGVEAYNIVSDTVSGVNIRKSDNVFQAKVILVCMLIGATIGAPAGALLSGANNRMVGALAGCLGLGFAGVVLGLFGSGIYLMIYRGMRHMKGKHD